MVDLTKYEITPEWVKEAREKSAVLKALVTGKGFHDLLIEGIEHLESQKKAQARRKYAKDIRDMFDRVNKKRYNVFEAVGGSEVIKLNNENLANRFKNVLASFKGNKSLDKYLSDYFFDLLDIDPNGLIFMEVKDNKTYPTYKSINDIKYYESNGQTLELLIFEPVKIYGNGTVEEFVRVVDKEYDYTFKKVGTTYTLVEEKTFKNPFGEIPAVILSDKQVVGSELRVSPIECVQELAKDYARDKSILTVYKFLNGFPIHWRYVSECRTCKGTGREGNNKCGSCNGDGILKRGDVTDVVNITPPRSNEQPILAPDIAGYINPSIEVIDMYNKELVTLEKKIYSTIWGNIEETTGNETATGRFIDVQPVINELARLSSNVEYVHNTLAKYVLKFVTPIKTPNDFYFKSYGKSFIIETPDAVLNKYNEAKEKGAPSTILDRLLNEFLTAKYKNDPITLSHEQKKAKLEPYIHLDTLTVFNIFGADEAKKKVLFQEWAKSADFNKDFSNLATEFNLYTNG